MTFIYATCKDTCPILTAKMATIQRKLGADFGPRVRFASITVEPEIDTPAVLKAYAEKHGADVAGWSFLTGPERGDPGGGAPLRRIREAQQSPATSTICSSPR